MTARLTYAEFTAQVDQERGALFEIYAREYFQERFPSFTWYFTKDRNCAEIIGDKGIDLLVETVRGISFDEWDVATYPSNDQSINDKVVLKLCRHREDSRETYQ